MLNLTDHKILQSFVTVARVGNVTRASEELNLTQPAISQHLKRLAEDTGLVLFRRSANGLELTHEGSILAAKAELALTTLIDFGQTARHLNGRVRGELKIGTIIDPDFVRLGAMLNALVKVAPGLEPQLVHGMSGDVIRRIVSGEIDVGYYLGNPEDGVRQPYDDVQASEPVFFHKELIEFFYWVIAPPGWESRVIGKSWPELAALPWIATPKASVHNRLLEQVLAPYGVTQNKVALVDQETSMLAMVRSGLGLSLCRDSIAMAERQANALVIADRVEVSTTLNFITLSTRRKDPRIDCAFTVIDEVWKDQRVRSVLA
ncbi:MAG: LysR family transcriptional regulator [Pseudomonadota bacterium]